MTGDNPDIDNFEARVAASIAASNKKWADYREKFNVPVDASLDEARVAYLKLEAATWIILQQADKRASRKMELLKQIANHLKSIQEIIQL